MSSKLLLFVLVSALLSWSGPGFALALQEAGWSIEYEIDFDNAQAARLNPIDGKIYVARFKTQANGGGIYRIDNPDPNNLVMTLLETVDKPRGLAIDPVSGDIYYSDGGSGTIGRIPLMVTPGDPPGTWSSGFHGGGDSDPIGLAIAPTDYTGDVLPMAPGDALFADEGTGGPKEVWRWNSETANDFGLVFPDDGSIKKPVDIGIGSDSIYLTDQAFGGPGALLRLDFDQATGTFVTEILLEDASVDPMNPVPFDLSSPMAVAVDPLTGDVIVADAFEDKIWRVSVLDGPGGTLTGTATLFADADFGDNLTGPIEASGLSFSTLGDRLIVTERGNSIDPGQPFRPGKIYVLSTVPEPGTLALLGLGLAALGRARGRPGSA